MEDGSVEEDAAELDGVSAGADLTIALAGSTSEAAISCRVGLKSGAAPCSVGAAGCSGAALTTVSCSEVVATAVVPAPW